MVSQRTETVTAATNRKCAVAELPVVPGPSQSFRLLIKFIPDSPRCLANSCIDTDVIFYRPVWIRIPEDRPLHPQHVVANLMERNICLRPRPVTGYERQHRVIFSQFIGSSRPRIPAPGTIFAPKPGAAERSSPPPVVFIHLDCRVAGVMKNQSRTQVARQDGTAVPPMTIEIRYLLVPQLPHPVRPDIVRGGRGA